MSHRYRAVFFSISILLLSGLLVGFQPAPASAQLKVEADIQLNKGDGKLSTTKSVSPKAGDTVVIEVFASGITNSLGFEAIVQFSNPAAVTKAEGSQVGGPYTLPLSTAIKDGKANLTVGGFSGVTIPAGDTKFIGSMTLTLATGVTTLGINVISADSDGKGPVSQNIPLSIAPALNNLITSVTKTTTHNTATLSWRTKFEGINHQVNYRASGTTEWKTALTALQAGATEQQVVALKALKSKKTDIQKSTSTQLIAALTAAGITTGVNDALILAVKTLDASVTALRHEVKLTGLTQNTTYEYEITATSLDGELSPASTGTFKTRTTPDVRPASITNINAEVGPTSVTLKWLTSRAGETRYKIYARTQSTRGALVTESDATDKIGRTSHKAEIRNLTLATEYEYEISTRLTGIDDLITDGTITETQATTSRTGTFKTRSTLPKLELVHLPSATTGTTANQISIKANQPVSVILDYGLIASNDRITGDVPTGDAFDADPLYPNRIAVSNVQEQHTIPLVGLTPESRYPYRVTLISLENERYTTDPRGKHKFSKDLTFRTLADILAPEITRGPIVRAYRDRAWFTVQTNVATTMTLYYGTSSTFNTPDEIAVPHSDRNGELSVTKSHSVVVTGLTGQASYQFRFEFKNVEGETLVWPAVASVKLAGKQTTGSVASFATPATADAQNPLITKGPTVVSASQTSMTIEWETDEPATSAVSFGTSTGALDEQATDGEAVLKHQIVLAGLNSATTYAIQVGSIDVSGNGPTQSQVAYGSTLAQADISAPKFVSSPALIYANTTIAEIQWIADELSNGQIIYGASATNLDKVLNASDFAIEQVLSITGLTANTQYFYQISMTDANGNGPTNSSVSSFTTATTADVKAPVVSAITATPLDNSAILTWTTDEISDTVVYFGIKADSLNQNLGHINTVTDHRIVLSNLQPGTTYTYVAQSTDRAGNGGQSQSATFTTLGIGAVSAPTAPTGLTAKAGNSAVRLTWNAPSTAAIGLVLERAEAQGDFTPLATLDIATEFLDNTVKNDIAYRYRLRAVGLQATGDPSTATAAVTPGSTGGPTAPKLYIVQGTPTTPTIVITNSTPITTGDVLTYTFQLSTQTDFSDVIALSPAIVSGAGLGSSDPSSVTAWTVERPLTDGTTYYYRVKANDGLFDSAFLTGTFKVNSNAAAYPGDLDSDLTVGFRDFLTFSGAFGKSTGQTGFVASADLNGDGNIGFPDFLTFVSYFNKTYIKGPSSGKPIVETALGIDTRSQFNLSGHMVVSPSGSELIVDVQLANVTSLLGYGLEIAYDPAIFEFVTATEQNNAFLKTGDRKAELFAVLDHNRETGRVFLGNAITQGSAVSGQGTLATMRFRVLDPNPQSADIHIAQGILFDADRNGFAAQNLGDRFSLLPTEFALEQNFPNPFNPETAIRYALPQAGRVSLVIYNLLGQEVTRLIDANQTPGFYTVQWNGQDALGRSVASGVYLYRLQADQFTQTYKMLLLK